MATVVCKACNQRVIDAAQIIDMGGKLSKCRHPGRYRDCAECVNRAFVCPGCGGAGVHGADGVWLPRFLAAQDTRAEAHRRAQEAR